MYLCQVCNFSENSLITTGSRGTSNRKINITRVVKRDETVVFLNPRTFSNRFLIFKAGYVAFSRHKKAVYKSNKGRSSTSLRNKKDGLAFCLLAGCEYSFLNCFSC